MKLNGIIKEIKDVETIGEKELHKRQLLLEIQNGKYPQIIPIDFLKKKTSLLDGFKPNQSITVHINFRGYETNGNQFCNLVGWKVYESKK